jgi:hypothetical protein
MLLVEAVMGTVIRAVQAYVSPDALNPLNA